MRLEIALEKANLELKFLVELLSPEIREKMEATFTLRLCKAIYRSDNQWWCVEHDLPADHDGEIPNEMCREYVRLKGCSCHTPEELETMMKKG